MHKYMFIIYIMFMKYYRARTTIGSKRDAMISVKMVRRKISVDFSSC